MLSLNNLNEHLFLLALVVIIIKSLVSSESVIYFLYYKVRIHSHKSHSLSPVFRFISLKVYDFFII